MSVAQAACVLQGANEVVHLKNEFLEVRVIPQLGARIISLIDRKRGRDWVWHPEHGSDSLPRAAGSSFEESGHGGIDECLPTVSACSCHGRQLPDHGEVWTTPGDIDRLALSSGLLRVRWALECSPFDFERAIAMAGSEIRLTYRLTNRGCAAEPFLWAWHPLLALVPGDRLELPPNSKTVTVETAGGLHSGVRGELWPLPAPFPDVNLHTLDLGPQHGSFLKGFVGPLAEGLTSAGLHAASGASLALTWDGRENPFLGIWLSRGYRGWNHLALEPCNCPRDSLQQAVADEAPHGRIEPGQTRTWSITIRVGGKASAALDDRPARLTEPQSS